MFSPLGLGLGFAVARARGVTDGAQITRIGVFTGVVGATPVGIVLAKVLADRAVPPPPPVAAEPPKPPPEKPPEEKPPGEKPPEEKPPEPKLKSK